MKACSHPDKCCILTTLIFFLCFIWKQNILLPREHPSEITSWLKLSHQVYLVPEVAAHLWFVRGVMIYVTYQPRIVYFNQLLVKSYERRDPCYKSGKFINSLFNFSGGDGIKRCYFILFATCPLLYLKMK